MRRAGIILAAALTLAGCGRAVPPGVTELVYASPYSPRHPFSRADQAWMKFVEQRSGGRIRIRPNWSGGLLSSEESMTELRHGVADIGLVTPIYVKGGAHLLRTQTGLYSGVRAIEDQVALYRCMAATSPQIQSELAGLHILAVQGGVLPGIVTRDRPVRSIADLRGLRIRAPGELLPVLRELGADPVNMPMGDVYSAMAKGVIDGVIAPEDTFKSLHLAEIAKHFASLDIPRGAYPARAISARKWAALPPDVRRVLDEGTAVWEAALADENRREQAAGRTLAVEEGVAFTTIPAADQARFTSVYRRDTLRNVEKLKRLGIDGMPTARLAAASIGPGGQVACRGTIA